MSFSSDVKEELKTLTWTPLPITIPEELCYLYGKYMEDYLARYLIKLKRKS